MQKLTVIVNHLIVHWKLFIANCASAQSPAQLKKVFPGVHIIYSLLCSIFCVPIAFCPVPGHHQKEPGSDLCILPSGIPVHWDPPWASLSAQWTGPALSAYPRRRDINILERAQWERNFVDFLFFFKSYVDMVLVTLLEQKGWNRWAPEVSLNLSHSVIVLPKILGLVIFIFRGNKIGNIQQITPNCRAWFRGLGSSPVCHWVCCSCTAYPIVSVCLFQLQGSCLGLETGGRELLCWTCCSSLFSTPLWC